MRLQRLFLILSFSLLTVLPAQAKGLFIINTGDEMFEVGEFPAEVVQSYPSAKDFKAGYKCEHFGVLWADVWTWNCALVAVTGENSYADLPDEVLTRLSGDPQYAFGKVKRDLWNQYGIALLVLLLVGFGVYSKMGKGKKADAAPAETAA